MLDSDVFPFHNCTALVSRAESLTPAQIFLCTKSACYGSQASQQFCQIGCHRGSDIDTDCIGIILFHMYALDI